VQGREGTGTRLQVVRRVVYGGPRRCCRDMARRGLGSTLHTASRARWYGTLRGRCAPLRRRTRCGASRQRRHQARGWWVVDLSNGVLPQKRVRQQGRSRTPAMAIGLAEPVWSSRDSLWSPVPPDPVGRHLREQRVQDLLMPALEAG
jgi:hypothetical protein